jgi:hypothetical protein
VLLIRDAWTSCLFDECRSEYKTSNSFIEVHYVSLDCGDGVNDLLLGTSGHSIQYNVSI